MAKRRAEDGVAAGEGPSADYEVGYGKPPKASQFKAGKSGNQKGRPKKVTTVAEALNRRLFAKVTVTENGKRKMITVVEAILGRLAQSSLGGDSRSIGHLIKLLNSGQFATGSGTPSLAPDPDADLSVLQEILSSMGITPESLCSKEAQDGQA